MNIVAVVSTVDDFGAGQWKDGLAIFQDHINSLGGLRLGEDSVGYVNVTVVRVKPSWSPYETASKYNTEYEKLCSGDGWRCADHRSAAACPLLRPCSLCHTDQHCAFMLHRAHVATKPTLYLTPPDVEDDVTNAILQLSLLVWYSTFMAGSRAGSRFRPNVRGRVFSRSTARSLTCLPQVRRP